MQLSRLVFLPLLVSLIISYFATPLVIKFAKRFDLIDDPKKDKHPKKIHTYPVPRGGGLAIFLGIAVSSMLFLPIDKHLTAILVGAFLLVLLGLLDDKYDLNPYTRLLFQFIKGFEVTHIKTLSTPTANHLAFIRCTRSPFF